MKTKILAILLCFMGTTTISTYAQSETKTTEKKEQTQRPRERVRRDSLPNQKMIKDLSLNDDQIKKLKDISANYDKKTKELRDKYKDDRATFMEKMKAQNEEREKEINNVLNDEQKKIWEKQKKEQAEQMKKMRENRNNRGDRGGRGSGGNRPAPRQ